MITGRIKNGVLFILLIRSAFINAQTNSGVVLDTSAVLKDVFELVYQRDSNLLYWEKPVSSKANYSLIRETKENVEGIPVWSPDIQAEYFPSMVHENYLIPVDAERYWKSCKEMTCALVTLDTFEQIDGHTWKIRVYENAVRDFPRIENDSLVHSFGFLSSYLMIFSATYENEKWKVAVEGRYWIN